MVNSVFQHLLSRGDGPWLRNRVAVFAFEECWQLSAQLVDVNSLNDVNHIILKIAVSKKDKSAAGLGALAYLYHESGVELPLHEQELRAVKAISTAIDFPNLFWEKARARATSDNEAVIRAAEESMKRGGWLWDKAFMLAGAYLSIREGMTPIEDSANQLDCPYWIALDRHTEKGRVSLHALSREMGCSFEALSWSNFYFESALLNASRESAWWTSEKRVRLQRAGLNLVSAESLWSAARDPFVDLVSIRASRLKVKIDSSYQKGLF